MKDSPSGNRSNVLSFFGHANGKANAFDKRGDKEAAYQLSLPFNDLNNLVLVHDSEICQVGTFVKFVREFRPRYVLDLRIAPRMDLIAGSRAFTFKLFEELNIQYIDLFGRIGIHSLSEFSSYRNDLPQAITSIVSDSEATSRPLVCFFDNETLFEECRKVLPSAVKLLTVDGEEPHVSIYRSGLLAV